jgi:hypothetical protein
LTKYVVVYSLHVSPFTVTLKGLLVSPGRNVISWLLIAV